MCGSAIVDCIFVAAYSAIHVYAYIEWFVGFGVSSVYGRDEVGA